MHPLTPSGRAPGRPHPQQSTQTPPSLQCSSPNSRLAYVPHGIQHSTSKHQSSTEHGPFRDCTTCKSLLHAELADLISIQSSPVCDSPSRSAPRPQLTHAHNQTDRRRNSPRYTTPTGLVRNQPPTPLRADTTPKRSPLSQRQPQLAHQTIPTCHTLRLIGTYGSLEGIGSAHTDTHARGAHPAASPVPLPCSARRSALHATADRNHHNRVRRRPSLAVRRSRLRHSEGADLWATSLGSSISGALHLP